MLAHAADIRRAANADGSFVVLFTKYPAPHGAYASGSWKRMVIRKDDLSSDMDRVIAHETGHIFGAPDEYGSSGCSCTSEHGRFFQEVNGNCVNCTDALRSDSGYPQSVGGSWGHAAPFSSDLDAALMHDNGKVYFFKGNQYVRFTNVGEGVDSGYPRSIAGNWPGVPVSFQSDLDSALMRDNGRIYLFKGSDYIRLSKGAECVMIVNTTAMCSAAQQAASGEPLRLGRSRQWRTRSVQNPRSLCTLRVLMGRGLAG